MLFLEKKSFQGAEAAGHHLSLLPGQIYLKGLHASVWLHGTMINPVIHNARLGEGSSDLKLENLQQINWRREWQRRLVQAS